MKAGFFETDITPPIGTERAGSYSKIFLQGIHDPLKVRASVFDNGTTKVALIGIDTCFIGSDLVKQAQDGIAEACGIQPENVIIGASHTHSGAALTGMVPEADIKDMPKEIFELAVKHSSYPSPGYREWVTGQIITAVKMADRKLEDALISIGKGHEDEAVFNRRFKMKNGRSYTHPGKCNPDIVEPAGPVDPEVLVIGAWREDGSLIGCVVNYACHGTCYSGSEASADWIYYMQDTVKKVMGQDAGVVFLNGACGDVTQVNNLAHTIDGGLAVAEKVGTRVGAEAVKVLVSSEHLSYDSIEAGAVTLQLKRRIPSPDKVQKSRDVLKAAKTEEHSTTLTFAKERVVCDYLCSRNPVVTVPVHAIQIGSAVFVSNPAEYFCQMGLDIKAGSPFEFTGVVSLANGSIGYVPTPKSFETTGGGYETVLTGYSNLEPQAGAEIVKASIALLSKFRPEQQQGSKSNAWSGPWEYGVLGPDID
jgi:hypothetical protein